MALFRDFWSPRPSFAGRLTWTLALAQQQPTATPLVQAVLRARRGNASRLDLTSLYTNTLADAPCAVAGPANGNLVRAHLSGGNLQTQSLAPLAGSAWTSWSTLCPATLPAGGFTGVSLDANADTVSVAYLTSTTALGVRDSANDGTTWGAAQAPGSTLAQILDLAIAFAPNGDALLVAAEAGGTIHTYRRAAGATTWTAQPSLVPPGISGITSIKLAYTGADWAALFAWQSGVVSYLGAALYGNGGSQALNTWSAVSNGLALGQSGGPSLDVSGFAWGSDGGHALLVEQWSSGGFTNDQAYHTIVTSAANFLAGRFTEPEPFAYSYPSGASLAVNRSAAGGYVVGAENLAGLLAQPADVDLSVRVVRLHETAAQHHGMTLLELDNGDGSLTALATSRDTLGKRLDLSLGYATVAGNELLARPQRWLTAATASWQSGRQLLTLTAIDGWGLLHQFQPRRQYSFSQFNTTFTLDQMIAWLLMRAGLEYTAVGSSTLRNRTPQVHLLPTQTGGTALLELLDKVEGWLVFGPSGAQVIPLATGDSQSYCYGRPGGHPTEQVFHQAELQAANLVTVYNGAHGQTIAAQAADAADARLLGNRAHEHTDTQLEQANAAATAAALLRKLQVSAPAHSAAVFPNLAQGLGDVVSLRDPLTGVSYLGRVRGSLLELDRDRGVWKQELSLTAV